jgi:hypothetical protein
LNTRCYLRGGYFCLVDHKMSESRALHKQVSWGERIKKEGQDNQIFGRGESNPDNELEHGLRTGESSCVPYTTSEYLLGSCVRHDFKIGLGIESGH